LGGLFAGATAGSAASLCGSYAITAKGTLLGLPAKQAAESARLDADDQPGRLENIIFAFWPNDDAIDRIVGLSVAPIREYEAVIRKQRLTFVDPTGVGRKQNLSTALIRQ
jgi:hypothetical protein